MTEQREAWSPPPDWQGDIEIEVRTAEGGHTLTLRDATREDWHGVDAALAEAAQRHAYGKAKREIEKRRREERERQVRRRAPAAPEADDEPEAGHTGPSTGHS